MTPRAAHRSSRHAARRGRLAGPWHPRRRGSALLLAVGVLAALAIIALTYSSTVRVERSASTAYASAVDYRAQADAVADEIGALLTADLFGQKIVTRDTPRWTDPLNPANFPPNQATPNVPLWPAMFEDGGFATYPKTDVNSATTTFRRGALTSAISGSASNVGNFGAVLFPDNPGPYTLGSPPPIAPKHESAFLASADPIDSSVPFGLNWDTWPQITNLRSAYRLHSGPDLGFSGQRFVWVRDDGRYADLAQFFLSRRARDLGADLADSAEYTTFGQRQSGAAGNIRRPFGVNQRVFAWQMPSIAEAYGNVGPTPNINSVDPVAPSSLDPTQARLQEALDQRFWADTDGDLRPDARWQTLDALDGRLGLRWVVAARIIDNSSRINVNTALDSGSVQDNAQPPSAQGFTPNVRDANNTVLPQDVAIRQTLAADGSPADVDLFRFLVQARLDPTLTTTTLAWPSPAGGGPLMRTNFLNQNNNPNDRPAWRAHLDRGLRATDLINYDGAQNQPASASGAFPAYDTSLNPAPRWRYTRLERAALYADFGLSGVALSGDVTAYGEQDEIDLRTYDGLNNDAILSRLEQALDFGYLPEQPSTLNAQRQIVATGPLRSAHPTALERAPGTPYGASPAAPVPSVAEVRDSVRRYLTTISGVADFSPVPVLNRATYPTPYAPDPTLANRPVFPDSAWRKPHTDDFAGPSPSAATPPSAAFREKAKAVQDVFASLVWALAPLAGDQPLIPGMSRATLRNPANLMQPAANVPASFNTGNALLNASAFSYGGGTIALDQTNVGDAPATAIGRATGEDMGAAYAVLRAAALAVNLADASDREPAGSVETPTVARLYNRTLLDGQTGQSPVTVPPGVIPLTVRFPQGDIVAADGTPHLGLLPPRFVGSPDGGVTLFGNERTLFLREVATFAVYEHPNARNPGGLGAVNPVTIDPANVDHHKGSIIAFEIGNPWPTDLATDAYTFRVQNERGFVQITLPSGSIPAGESRVFLWRTTQAVSGAGWDALVTSWRDTRLSLPPSGNGGVVDLSAQTPTVSVGGSAVATPSRVVFQDIITGGSGDRTTVAALILNTGSNNVLVDRMSPPVGSARSFPAALTGSVNIPAPPPPQPTIPGVQYQWAGRLARAWTLRRPTDSASVNPGNLRAGFPAYVVETRRANEAVGSDPSGSPGWHQTFLIGGAAVTGPPGVDKILESMDPDTKNYEEIGASGYKSLARDKGALPKLSSFQVFIPDAPLRSVAELGMLSAFCTMYVHSTASPPDLANLANLVNVTTNVAGTPSQPVPTSAAGGGFWLTLGEQLGNPAHLFRGVPAGGVGNGPATLSDPPSNPYLGALDLSGFVLESAGVAPPVPVYGGSNAPAAGMGAVVMDQGTLPAAMAVPLASRVFDAIDSRPRASDALARGVVNLNTAPLRVLRMLPWVSPWHGVYSLQFGGALRNAEGRIFQNTDRAAFLADYRDAVSTAFSNDPQGRATALNFRALRYTGEPTQPAPGATTLPSAGQIGARGLASLGETSLLTYWDLDANGGGSSLVQIGTPPSSFIAYEDFGTLAQPDTSAAINAGVPTSLTAGVVTPDGVLGLHPSVASTQQGATVAHDPINDPEQRLGVFRGMANAASVRSDVFTAWYIIRAYDPRAIAAIPLPTNRAPNANELASAMEQLTPVHESRWLVVYDRSNVRSPTDRPRVVMKVELPPK